MTAKTLMVQGTGSGVGKSILTAALCRYFYLDGWRVAPFKAQNMSLNSFVTESGGEIGRAQAYQAEACGIRPEVTMNPILLKPCGDNLSQVIVMGKVTETRDAKNYYSRHAKHKNQVRSALNALRENYELVVLEGAGSPAEINLKQWDLVNMPMAKMADAPVLIVGDIDRGGVFAWMKGTFDLLTREEQDRVGGFIINKFRGDPDLLAPGLDQFEALVNKPVLGVIPYYRDLVVDEEDAIPARSHPGVQNEKSTLDAAVIWLPRISNFTDVSPLAADPSVSLRYVTHPEELRTPDLIILPGSKNSVDDLEFIKSQGLDRAIRQCAESGTVVLGICAGFQFLGARVCDPQHVESRRSESQGLNLFDFSTTLLPQKTTRQVRCTTVSGPVFESGLNVEGYEIHMGITEFKTRYYHLFAAQNGDESLGISNAEGTVLGTYLHGFLDRNDLREAFLHHVRLLRNRPMPSTPFDYQAFRKTQLDKLAKLAKDHLDMDRIKELISERKT